MQLRFAILTLLVSLSAYGEFDVTTASTNPLSQIATMSDYGASPSSPSSSTDPRGQGPPSFGQLVGLCPDQCRKDPDRAGCFDRCVRAAEDLIARGFAPPPPPPPPKQDNTLLYALLALYGDKQTKDLLPLLLALDNRGGAGGNDNTALLLLLLNK